VRAFTRAPNLVRASSRAVSDTFNQESEEQINHDTTMGGGKAIPRHRWDNNHLHWRIGGGDCSGMEGGKDKQEERDGSAGAGNGVNVFFSVVLQKSSSEILHNTHQESIECVYRKQTVEILHK
jgi:hypothetical protein